MILVTGGAGYIGSHTVVELCSAGYEPVIFDNFCNSDLAVLQRIKTITGKHIAFFEGDIRSPAQIEDVFSIYRCF